MLRTQTHGPLIRRARAAAGAVALAALLAPHALPAQEEAEDRRRWMGPGLVLDEDGRRRPPTPADALRLLAETAIEPPGQQYGYASFPAVAVLTQRYERHPRAELDALADAMVKMILADESVEGRVRKKLVRHLRSASQADAFPPGAGATPYEGAFDRLRRVYETLADRALAGGGPDPFHALYDTRDAEPDDAQFSRRDALRRALFYVYHADPAGRGRDYVLAIIARGQPEGVTWETYSAWCAASKLLHENDPESLPDHDAYRANCRFYKLSPSG